MTLIDFPSELEAKRYSREVVKTSSDLASLVTGTYEGPQLDEIKEMIKWLEWRVSAEGWEQNRSSPYAAYENAVLSLAEEALKLVKTCGWKDLISSEESSV